METTAKKERIPVQRVRVRIELPVDGRLQVLDPLERELQVVLDRRRFGLGDLDLLLKFVLLGVRPRLSLLQVRVFLFQVTQLPLKLPKLE